LISLGSAFLIVLVANRTVFRPLSRLTRAIEEFRKGNLSHRVYVEGNDEIGVIGSGLNELASSVQEEHRKLEEASMTDSLTCLANARYFWVRANEEARRSMRRSSPLSLLLIDVDHFKRYNDLKGHCFGDLLLSSLGRLLKQSARVEDLVARYGGDEFSVLLPGTSLSEALAMAERLRSNVAMSSLGSDSHCHPLTISIGVAAFHSEMTSASALVEAADSALYQAKAEGRDCVRPLKQPATGSPQLSVTRTPAA
jgi:diguanylate cyclase (GGDEF)-like protein